MKRKIFTIGTALMLAFSVSAQTEEVTNKNGVIVTPEAGDWALGFNAAPLLNYVGNMFNGTTNNSMGTGFVNQGVNQQFAPLNAGNAIYGKYFVDASTAYRGQLRLMTGNMSFESLYGGMNGDSLSNTVKYSGGGVVLGAGLEKRRGHGRVQGYYGGEVLITLGGSNATETYSYAVDMDSAAFNAGVLVDENGSASLTRTDSKKYGSTFGVGVRGFIGVEYFVLPKISIGGEFGWGVAMTSTKGSETTTSTLDYATNVVTQTTVMGGKSSTFGVDTDNFGGSIKLLFHF